MTIYIFWLEKELGEKRSPKDEPSLVPDLWSYLIFSVNHDVILIQKHSFLESVFLHITYYEPILK